MTIGIHQPNYLPWAGYFNKMKRCDKFVIFDDVQLPRGQHSFETRSLIKSANGEQWLTIPVKNKDSLKQIKDVEIDGDRWKKKHLKALELNYHKAPYFEDYINPLAEIYGAEWTSLKCFNTFLIKQIASWLDINTEICFSSDMDIFGEGEGKIIQIIQKLGGDKYISGTGEGSKKYVKEEAFEKYGIEIIWQTYVQMPYHQLYGNFLDKTSVIDLLMNMGPESIKFI